MGRNAEVVITKVTVALRPHLMKKSESETLVGTENLNDRANDSVNRSFET